MMQCSSWILLVVVVSMARALPLQEDKDKIEYTVRGDMRFPAEASRVLARGLVPDRTWPNGVVPYTIGNFTSAERAIIQNLLNEIAQRTCVRFVPWTNQKTYLDIFNGDGCWSYVGYYSGFTNQPLSLGSSYCVTRPVTFHEVLHALGFIHEQDREDRDYNILVRLDNVDPNENGLMKAYDTVSLGIPFNVASAMHYSPNDFSNNGKPVFVSTRPHHPVGNNGIVWSDFRRVNRLYGCPASYEAALDLLEY